MESLRIECEGSGVLDIEKLTPFQGALKSLSKDNYLKLKTQMLAEGFSFPIFVWQHEGSNFIIDGHQRLNTLTKMREEGYKVPPIPIASVKAPTYKAAKKKVLAAASVYGRVDEQGLYEFLNNAAIDIDELVEKFDLPHIDMEKFQAGYSPEGGGGGNTDPDDVPEPPKVAKSKLGQIYKLGEHRLMCGDSTKREDVERLMGGEKASIWLSDPPYGINHVEVSQEKKQSKGYSKIANDDLKDDEFKDFIFKVISTSLPHMKKGFAFYMWHAMKMQGYTAAAAAAAAGILFHRQIIWVKPQFVFGRGHYHWRHELCLMGWLQGDEPPFYGERNQSTIWEVGRENDKIHPTQKPVPLLEPSITNHTKPGELIYEPFCGSGSTLIACEKTKRKCYGMEIDPIYVDVIIKRWTDYTGQKAELISG
jgi:DNA modification methylase